MMLPRMPVLAATAALAVASAQTTRPWQAPGPDDSRGPCPMLNTLANHGYLPHNGRNITAGQCADAVSQGLNVDRFYGTVPASFFALGFGKSTFDLEDLNKPGVIQHIASLTRNDVTPTDQSLTADPTRIAALLNDSSTDYLTVASLAASRDRVEKLSAPQRLSPQGQQTAYFEAGMLLMMMKEGEVPSALTFPDPRTWRAPKERVRVWLTEERLPEELGWKRNARTVSAMDWPPVTAAIEAERMGLSARRRS
ncbi:Chloroperoxidase [Metarhizium album ARSEF 1941]|uniref:Chloroperoxidase n=1 Tax=Metarhizium album (strain ARSEF 1941) TaxID=1081103 RepID=A0A0B2WLR2_METAS|nr:Chloroperoxidase [Metarhizium album ARSEF 1941]KHN94422.1 Chloroperoxidase [Metarhizium album ARSEF 1941]